MEKLEDKLVQVLDLSMEGAKLAGGKLAQLTEQYGPQAVDAVLMIVRIDRGGSLLIGFSLAVAALVGVKVGSSWLRKGYSLSHNDGEGYCIGGALLCVASVACSVFAAFKLLNIWNWVGVFAPSLWLARKVAEKALGL